jgi:transcriptional regulator with XRE-family HTH domain
MGQEDREDRFNKQMGLKIRAARKDAGLLQSQLAQLAGLSRASITNIEGGSQAPPPYRLILIAEALKVDPSALLPKSSEIGSTSPTMPKHLAEALASVTSAARKVEEARRGEG